MKNDNPFRQTMQDDGDNKVPLKTSQIPSDAIFEEPGNSPVSSVAGWTNWWILIRQPAIRFAITLLLGLHAAMALMAVVYKIIGQ